MVRDNDSSQDISLVWKAYKESKSAAQRNRLMQHYMPLVRFSADRLGAKLPKEVEKDDLVSAGVFGLIDAIDAFDLGRGIKFETYCTLRIRGAILDELRCLDWVPRLVRSRAHHLKHALQVLEAGLGRTPTDEELARKMDLSDEEFAKVFQDAYPTMMKSFSPNAAPDDSDWDGCEIESMEDKRSSNPVREALENDLKSLVTRGLTRAERLIILLYYFENLTMKEIGRTLDLSESRVSQMHSALIEHLRAGLKDRHKELVA